MGAAAEADVSARTPPARTAATNARAIWPTVASTTSSGRAGSSNGPGSPSPVRTNRPTPRRLAASAVGSLSCQVTSWTAGSPQVHCRIAARYSGRPMSTAPEKEPAWPKSPGNSAAYFIAPCPPIDSPATDRPAAVATVRKCASMNGTSSRTW